MGRLCAAGFTGDALPTCLTDVIFSAAACFYAVAAALVLVIHPNLQYFNVPPRGTRLQMLLYSKLDNARYVSVALTVLFNVSAAIVLVSWRGVGYEDHTYADSVFGYVAVVFVGGIYLVMLTFEVVKGRKESTLLSIMWVVLLVARAFSIGHYIDALQQPASSPVVNGILYLVSMALLVTSTVLCTLFRANRATISNVGLGQQLLSMHEVGGSGGMMTAEGGQSGVDMKLPELEAGWFSILTFSWLNRLIATGKRRALQEEDLFDLHPSENSDVLSRLFEGKWREEVLRGPTHAFLTRALCRSFYPIFLVSVALKFTYDCLQFVGPQMLKLTLNYLNNDEPTWRGYLYVFGMFAAPVTQTFVLHQYFHRCFRLGMRLKSVVTQTVYRKSLRISPGMAGKLNADGSVNRNSPGKSTGEIVNLMSIDAQRLQDLMAYFHTLWSAPFQITVAIVMLWFEVGPAVFAGVAVLAASVPLTGVIARRMRSLQQQLMKVKDERIKVTNEVMSGMKIIKFYAWETSFGESITSIRNEELKILWRYRMMQTWSRFMWGAVPVLVSAATFTAFVLAGNELTASKAFTSLALFNILRFPTQMLPNMINNCMEARVSVLRLQEFLETPEISALPPPGIVVPGAPTVSVRDAELRWPDGSPLIDHISFECKPGQLTMIVGATGAGKSGLLASLIGDIKAARGSVSTGGNIGYAAQVAWIQNSTVQDNICFGKRFSRRFYDDVLDACALKHDLEILPAGDQTEIGEKGINLSGGQKQRVSLARAVYQQADVYLLDDCLSAVDSHVAQHIFHKCIKGLLRQKTVVLVTHKLELLSEADQIVFLRDRTVAYCGGFDGFRRLPDAYSALMRMFQEYKDEADDPDYAEDEQQTDEGATGETGGAAQMNGMKPSGAGSALGPPNTPKRDISSKSRRSRLSSAEDIREKQKEEKRRSEGALIDREYVEAGAVSRQVYWHYFMGCGGVAMVVWIILSLMGQQGSSILSNSWLSYWSDNPQMGQYMGLGFYVLFSFIQTVMSFAGSFVNAAAGQKGARHFHQGLIRGVMRAPMAFFDTTPTGRLINRFSKDTYTIDEVLPNSIFMYLWTLSLVLGTIGVVAFVVPWFIAALFPLGWYYLATQEYYIPSSRQLKRLDSVLRSPIFAHFSETLDGVPTIRAFRAQDRFIFINEQRLDSNLRAYYLNVASNRWLAIRLEFVGTCAVSLTGLLAVLGRGTVAAGLGGLAISYALNVTQILNWMVRMASERESNIVSVERVKEYAELPGEAPAVLPDHRPPQAWPQQGAVTFMDYQMRYRPNLPLVLMGLNFTIRPGEKVGIVGRTGAGKSSMLQALLRLVEPAGGCITVDGVDVTSIGLFDLRSKFSIIPQDPTLFTGTVRSNLDPFQQYSDAAIWDALQRSYLKAKISEGEGGLDQPVEEGGRNFSLGQRQLMCLARALLRNSKILLLDEATSAVDQHTDQLIQRSIRTSFTDSTVMTIAHRIDTILDYDRVMVMDAGNVAEFDAPMALLDSDDSIFRSMAQGAGITSAAAAAGVVQKLRQAAEETSEAASSAANTAEATGHVGNPVYRGKRGEMVTENGNNVVSSETTIANTPATLMANGVKDK